MESGVVDPDPVHPTRSEPWFEDGNLVLQAENTQFRIHRGIICASSTVFNDMFGLSHLVSGDEIVDGCPIIHLSDSAVDVLHVLKAICDRAYRCEIADSSSLPMISAFLRLGKKYGINQLFDEAMKLLRQRCPSTLQAFDNVILRVQDSAFYIQVINLALEIGSDSLLPAALSILVTFSSLPKIAGGLSANSKTYFLRHEGLTMICLGRDRLRNTFFRTFNPTCLNNVTCHSATLEIVKVLENMDIIFTLRPFCSTWQGYLQGQFCSSCAKDVLQRWNDQRKTAWEELPSFYGLSSWGELLSS